MLRTINPIYWAEKPIEAEVFAPIAEIGHNLPLPDGFVGVEIDTAIVGRKDELIYSTRPELNDSYIEIARLILACQDELGRLNGLVRMNAHSIRVNMLYPDWHADDITDAFSISPDASTLGVEGTFEADEAARTTSEALNMLETEDQLKAVGLSILVPPVGVYVAVPPNAPHKSPDFVDNRLLITGSVSLHAMDVAWRYAARAQVKV